MDEQEIRAKALEIASLIIGQSKPLSAYNWKDISVEPPPVEEIQKYECLAALIERDIRTGLPNQDVKYIIERYNISFLKERFTF
jgi:hypothetical protein